MGYVKQIYDPYKVIDGTEYFSVGTVAEIVGKSRQTIQLWDSWSDELKTQGKERLIPKSSRIGKNRVRCWTSSEIDLIVKFSKNIEYGQLAEFSRTRWGERGKNLTQDRSVEARKAKKLYRKLVDKNGRKIQNQRKIDSINAARQHMYKYVRKYTKQIYE